MAEDGAVITQSLICNGAQILHNTTIHTGCVVSYRVPAPCCDSYTLLFYEQTNAQQELLPILFILMRVILLC